MKPCTSPLKYFIDSLSLSLSLISPLPHKYVGSFLKAMLCSRTMVIGLEPASETPGRLAKTQSDGFHTQTF